MELAAAGTALAAGVAAAYRSVAAVELFYDASSARIQSLLPQLHALRAGYRPPPLLPWGLAQTALAERFRPPDEEVRLKLRRETLELQTLANTPNHRCCPAIIPAGLVSVDWLDVESHAAPICILVPGLTGSSDSAYIQRIAKALWESGLRVACYNPRGRGGNEILTPFFYSAGFTADLRRVVEHIATSFPNAPLTAAGFSLGANYLAKYVGEEGGECLLKGAAVFACPLDCSTMSANLCSGSLLSRGLDRFVLVPSVKKVLDQFREKLETATDMPGLDVPNAALARSMAEFDGCVVAPMMGESSAANYYAAASSVHVLSHVRVPMLFVSARNDMITPADLIDKEVFRKSGVAPLLLAVTPEGGHSMVWPQGWRGKGSWTCIVLIEWVQAVLAMSES